MIKRKARPSKSARGRVPKIENLQIDKIKGRITWVCNGQPIAIEEPGAEGVLADERGIVLALTDVVQGFPRKLAGFGCDGSRRFAVGPPPGFTFSHLTRHPLAPSAVVAGGAERVDGWMDWHFTIDEHTGELKRFYPAY